MQSFEKVDKQLKKLNVNYGVWGRAEAKELCNILQHDEVIEECVNGYYEAGFAMLVATKHRVLLVDKKPFNFLNVEDMRFDMINELDYSHRLFGAQIRISAGSKNFSFTSWNQVKLRRLMTYVQYRMSAIKTEAQQHQDEQQRHLEAMNKQLEMYLKLQQFYQQPQPAGFQSQPPVAAQAGPAGAAEAGPEPAPAEAPNSGGPSQAETLERLATAEILQQTGHTKTPSDQPKPVPATDNTTRSYLHALVVTPQQLSIAAAKRVLPVISAYTRLPLLSQRRRAVPHTSANYTPASS